MTAPLSTLKSLVGLDQKDSNAEATKTTSSSSTIEPTSDIVEGNGQKTELQPSAPAAIPARLPPASEVTQADDDIAMAADAEAGVSLNEIMPVRRGS